MRQVLKEKGLTDEQVRAIYDLITDKFVEWCDRPDIDDFRAKVASIRKHQRKLYHEIIDEACKTFAFFTKNAPTLNWRNVKVEPRRFKRCAICHTTFYDLSRNGKKLTCDRRGEYKRWDFTNRQFVYYVKNGARLSECAAEYELRRRDTVARSVARSNEVLTDFNPDPNDIKGVKFLRYVEAKAQKLW